MIIEMKTMIFLQTDIVRYDELMTLKTRNAYKYKLCPKYIKVRP